MIKRLVLCLLCVSQLVSGQKKASEFTTTTAISGLYVPVLYYSAGTFANKKITWANLNLSNETRLTAIESSSNHFYSYFADSSRVIDLTVNVWSAIKNQWGNLFPIVDTDGFTKSGDSVVFQNAGHYIYCFGVNISGASNNIYEYRIMRKNGAVSTLYSFKVTGTGTYVQRSFQTYVEADSGTKVWVEIRNITNSQDVTILGGSIIITQIH